MNMFVFMVQLSFCFNITVFIQPHTVLCGDISEIWSLFVAVSVLSRYLSSLMLMLYISDRSTCWCPSVCCCTWFIAKKLITHVVCVWNTADKVFSVWVKVIGVMLTCNMTNLGQCNHPPPFTTTGYKRQDWKKQRGWGYHHQALCVNVCMWK